MTQLATSIPDVMTVPRFVGGGKIETTEKVVPRPGPGQLLIKVKSNALCGSERPQFWDGTEITPGHEAAGVVVAAGPQTSTAIGTLGGIFLMDFCGQCRWCLQGYTNQCLAKRGDMGFNRDGGYGVYELINETLFFPVSDDFSATEVTLLLDVMGTGGHAIKRAQLCHDDIQSILIPGAGPVGLGILAMAKILLGSDLPVVISDVSPYRLAMAEALGGLPVNVSEVTLAEGLKKHRLDAPDVAIDAAGRADVRDECLSLLAHRGVLVSVAHGGGLAINNLYRDFVFREMTLIGSEYFAYRELAGNYELLKSHREYIGQIITHRLGVDEIQHAFELFFGGATGKVVIEQ